MCVIDIELLMGILVDRKLDLQYTDKVYPLLMGLFSLNYERIQFYLHCSGGTISYFSIAIKHAELYMIEKILDKHVLITLLKYR